MRRADGPAGAPACKDGLSLKVRCDVLEVQVEMTAKAVLQYLAESRALCMAAVLYVLLRNTLPLIPRPTTLVGTTSDSPPAATVP